MAQLPRIYVSFPEIRSKFLDKEEEIARLRLENSRLQERINEMQHVIDDITNISSNGGNSGIKKESNKGRKR